MFAIEVKATERTLLISAERRSPGQLGGPGPEAKGSVTTSEGVASGERGRGPLPTPLISEFRYDTCSRSFRFPVAIVREQLQAVYGDGLLTATASKASTVSTVIVKVEG